MQWLFKFFTKGVPIGEAWASAVEMVSKWWDDPKNKLAVRVTGMLTAFWAGIASGIDWIGSFGWGMYFVFALFMLPVTAFLAGSALMLWRWATNSGHGVSSQSVPAVEDSSTPNFDQKEQFDAIGAAHKALWGQTDQLDQRIGLTNRAVERLETLVSPKGNNGLTVSDWILIREYSARNLKAFDHHISRAEEIAGELQALFEAEITEDSYQAISDGTDQFTEALARADGAYQRAAFSTVKDLAGSASLNPGTIPIARLNDLPGNLHWSYRYLHESLDYLNRHRSEMRENLDSDFKMASLEIDTMALLATKRLRTMLDNL